MVLEPAYTFELPSLQDSTILNARIYHPTSLQHNVQISSSHDAAQLKGAVVAHPYAPLGGSYDDHVVLAVTETLLGCGFVVATFNFRSGSGDSQGRTSWTGQGELDDYTSIAGCLIHYLRSLSLMIAEESFMGPPDQTPCATTPAKAISLDLLLAGYSYGSLILARLPPLSTIASRFEDADIGTPPAEIVLRAHTLAKATRKAMLQNLQSSRSPRALSSSMQVGSATRGSAGRPRAATVTIGGEESDSSQRHRSDVRRSGDFVRKSIEAPYRMVAHVRRGSGGRGHAKNASEPVVSAAVVSSFATLPELRVRYLVVSPVIVPFTTLLMPPGPPVPGLNFRHVAAEARVGAQFLRNPTLAVFGTVDSFTSCHRLSGWAEKQAVESSTGDFMWEQVEGAGHFWREQGKLRALHESIDRWVRSSFP
nr:hypothetical protein CFP56_09184 [Quercus suber]